MKPDERILQRLDELLTIGEKVLSSRQDEHGFVDDKVDTQLANQWATSTQSLLARTFGEQSSYFNNFLSATQKYVSYSPAVKGMGILRAAKDDFEHGYLFNVRGLIEAEVFDDFLEQAEHLFASGYFQPAAVVAGCVLEDALRRLCSKRGVIIPDHATIEPMNTELVRNGVYNKLVQKKITALADLRNKAAHGRWKEFSDKDVEEMLRQVRTFLSDIFT